MGPRTDDEHDEHDGVGAPAGVAMRGRARRAAFVALVVVLAGLALVVSVAAAGQDAYVYGAPADPPDLTVLPGAEAVTYRTADGIDLQGWFLLAGDADLGVTAVVFHGSHSTREAMAGDAMELADRGISVLLAEYRGFGGLAGEPSEDGLRHDARAAAAYVRSRPDVNPDRVLYLGYSLGTGPAVDLAAADPPAALVLLAPYTSLTELADVDFAPFPMGLFLRTTFDSENRIRDVHVPVLVARGSADPIVPPEMGTRVFEAANDPKGLVTVDGADHGLDDPTDPDDPEGPVPADLVVAFVEREVLRR